MLRLQTEGIYPAAFAAIKVSVLMVHGTFDPYPGRLIFKVCSRMCVSLITASWSVAAIIHGWKRPRLTSFSLLSVSG
jgi:hypothetical protein